MSVLVDPVLTESVRATLQAETGSLGVRGALLERWPAARVMDEVEVEGAPVQVKVSPGRVKVEQGDAAAGGGSHRPVPCARCCTAPRRCGVTAAGDRRPVPARAARREPDPSLTLDRPHDRRLPSRSRRATLPVPWERWTDREARRSRRSPRQDAESWTDEQWISWLEATDDPDAPDDARRRPPLALEPGRSASMLGAAMLGLHEVIYGPHDDEIAIVVDAGGDPPGDDLPEVHLDPDHPERSEVIVRRATTRTARPVEADRAPPADADLSSAPDATSARATRRRAGQRARASRSSRM